MTCDACKNPQGRRFATSGAMDRGCQFVWVGFLCEGCIEKYRNFEIQIWAGPLDWHSLRTAARKEVRSLNDRGQS
jgi:hypothetical protein